MLNILQEGDPYTNVSELTNNSAPLNVLYFTAIGGLMKDDCPTFSNWQIPMSISIKLM